MFGTDMRTSWFLGVLTLEICVYHCITSIACLKMTDTEDLGEIEYLKSQSVEYESNTK